MLKEFESTHTGKLFRVLNLVDLHRQNAISRVDYRFSRSNSANEQSISTFPCEGMQNSQNLENYKFLGAKVTSYFDQSIVNYRQNITVTVFKFAPAHSVRGIRKKLSR